MRIGTQNDSPPLYVLLTTGAFVCTALTIGPIATSQSSAIESNAKSAPDEAGDNETADEEIAAAIEAELIGDGLLHIQQLDVAVKNSIVQLKGSVASLAAKRRAARIASSVRDVKSVINAIEIRPSQRADHQVESLVVSALGRDPASETKELRVDVQQGVVHLRGTVQSHTERMAAEETATEVAGVRDIENEILVATANERPDSEILADVRARLRSDVLVHSNDISVDVKDGRVTLCGTTSSTRSRDRAFQIAWVAGVEHVELADVAIETQTDSSRPRRATLNEHEILQAITRANEWDARLNAADVDVTVQGGVATLSGKVDTLQAQRAAEENARNTLGVGRVVNKLMVRPGDAAKWKQIAEEAQQAIRGDAFLESQDISVELEEGTAKLRGQVSHPDAARRAESVLQRFRGIQSVSNDLQVAAQTDVIQVAPEIADRRLKYRIKNRLYWDTLVDDRDVNVIVSGGEVTLRGVVWDDNASSAASRISRQAGAKRVQNRLRIRNTP